MREELGLRSWIVGAIAVCLFSASGALASTSSGALYTDTYPGQGSNVVTSGKDLAKALTTASLTYGFTHPSLTQDVPARFRATVVYGRGVRPIEPTIKLAYGNDASLTPIEADTLRVVPVTSTRQYLDEGTGNPGGGYRLTWAWDVVPLQSGQLHLVLEIKPVLVVVGGSSNADLAVRNEPIVITVEVNPNRKALEEVATEAQHLKITVPGSFLINERVQVVAALPLKGHQGVVRAGVDLARDQGSTAATIESAGSDQQADQLVSRWLVTPADSGPMNMVFTVSLSTTAGEIPVSKAVTVRRSATVEPAPPSLWDRLQTPVLWITPFVVLIGLLLGLRKSFSQQPRAVNDVEGSDE